jgi:hypothetical protein
MNDISQLPRPPGIQPCTYQFPCSLGDKVVDTFTGFVCTVSGLVVWGDGSKQAQVVWINPHGQLQYDWIACARLKSAT